ncbi:MAG TPA: glycosyltransferase [Candidatus Limnocylindria bacterium]|nr:glycosyltransferase [Candidatus Limnocylindria bacterium]
MRALAFWGSLGALVFAYLIYPAASLLRGRWGAKPYTAGPITPALTVVIAAHNEGAVIGRKLDALLASDYPPAAMQVIVASDGSDDQTVAAAQTAGASRVDVLDLPRNGKAAALNAAVARASGDIVVFTDANSIPAPDALRRLVAPFADPMVGGVAGNQVYQDSVTGGRGELAYWDIDRRLKAAESRAGSAVSATGALYAIRRELVHEVPEGVTDDFINSTRVVEQGRRLVFAVDAIVYEDVAETSRAEFDRKVRVMTRGLRGVIMMRRLLDPRRYGFYSVQLFTQKVLKRLTVVPHLLILASTALGWKHARGYRLLGALELGIGAAAVVGLAFPRSRIGRHPVFSVPAYFCMANAASLLAIRNVLGRRALVRWDTARTKPMPEDER